MQVDEARGRTTVKRFIGFAGLTDLYTEFFLDYYQFGTLDYYEKESSRLSESLTPARYILHVARRIEQETQRLRDCVPDSSWGRVLDIVDDELIRPRVKNDGFCGDGTLSELYTRRAPMTCEPAVTSSVRTYAGGKPRWTERALYLLLTRECNRNPAIGIQGPH